MKKIITMFLLTALCMTVLTSCDLGNGLVAELFGDVKDLTIGEQIYPTDDYIAVETDIMYYPPVEEIETTPSYEIMTEDYTIEEYWTADISIDIEPVPVPDAYVEFGFPTIEFISPYGIESQSGGSSILNALYAVKPDLISLTVIGTATLYAGDCTVGYTLGEEYIFDESFWGVGTDSEPEYRELRIKIPAEQLADGNNKITLVYEMNGQIYEIGWIVVIKEVPTEEDSVDVGEIPEVTIE
ncbi:MAG: hypothetical protein IIW17_01570 [Clostridia bacterium]|nr:hypothetical protein [Clostridia bacterium]MBQ2256402.1 hypothetical protein [Clostridia bacterium]MBQ5792687.1 hypothetical protein [Clostridia bacterium]